MGALRSGPSPSACGVAKLAYCVVAQLALSAGFLILFPTSVSQPLSPYSPSQRSRDSQEGWYEAPWQRILSNSPIALLLWPGGHPEGTQTGTAGCAARRRSASPKRVSGTQVASRNAETSKPEDCQTGQEMRHLPRGIHGLRRNIVPRNNAALWIGAESIRQSGAHSSCEEEFP